MRLLFLLLIGLVAAFVGYWVYWTRLSDELARGLERWIAEQRAAGYVVKYAHIERRGFPSRLVLEVQDPEISRPAGPTAWRWRADWIEAWAAPWRVGRPVVRFDGRHRITYRDGAALREVVVTAEKAFARLTIDGAGLRHLAADIQGVDVRPSAGSETVRIAQIRLQIRANREAEPDRPTGSYDLAAKIDEVTLPETATPPLGRRLDLVGLSVTTLGPLPRGFDDEALGVWRDAGGALEVRALKVVWGGVEAQLEGRIGLDRELRPAGLLRSKIRGAGRLIDALAGDGRLGQGEAVAAKAVLGLLSRTGTDGRPVLEVPVAARNGRLSIGPVSLLPLPPLAPAAARSPVRRNPAPRQ